MCHPQRVCFTLPFIVALSSEDCSLQIWFLSSVGIADIAKRERNKGAKQLDALTKVSLD